MKSLVINGPAKLHGRVKISGSKNAALPAIAATLLTTEPCQLRNIPNITDTQIMLSAIQELGSRVKKTGSNSYLIQSGQAPSVKLSDNLGNQLRASILFAGPLLGRLGDFSLPYPGGCLIGKRPIDTHLTAFQQLGAKIYQNKTSFSGSLGSTPAHSISITLNERSVTATENIIMASVLGQGSAKLTNTASEPHIQDLIRFLNKMGAKITGRGDQLTIQQVDTLKGARHTVIPDEIETGTFAVAAAVTKSQIQIDNIPDKIEPITSQLKKMGVKINPVAAHSIVVSADQIHAAKIQVNVWPGLPTDMQPPLTVLATQAEGTCEVHDWMFENRLNYTKALNQMGAKIKILDTHTALVQGPTPLSGQSILSPDLRAGIAYVIAGLAARGKTSVENAELIERGYENLVSKLQGLGVNISEHDS